jgi:hypothetical protein
MHHTLRNCSDFKNSVGHDQPFQPLPPPPPQGEPTQGQPQQHSGGGGGAFPCIYREVNVIFGGHGAQENKRQQKLADQQVLVATNSAPTPYRGSEHTISFSRADQWLNFDHPGKYPLLVDLVIQESRVKKVLVDGGSRINVTVRADFQGAVECFRRAIQTALTAKPLMALSARSDNTPEGDDLTIPSNKASATTSMRARKEMERINLRFSDERKTTVTPQNHQLKIMHLDY